MPHFSDTMPPPSEIPELTQIDITRYPKLDVKQAGHLRHYFNMVAQQDGDWHLFETSDSHEEFDDAKRYQLATMAYATGAAHYHRLPALRGQFRALMRRMIHKMLLREVWSYWYLASHSGKVFDPDLQELRQPWADPVRKENIMYSGHLLSMTSLYAMLFDDDEFERPGGLTFRWNPLFWGMGPEDFPYSNPTLQEVILKQMEENQWVGFCCEPNAIFVVCNQFPLIAMRYNDVRNGTNVVEEEVLPKYRAALKAKGMLGEDGLYASFFAVRQKKPIPAKHGAHTAWANTFMHSWNSGFVESSYEKQTLGFLTQYDGRTQLHPTKVAVCFRDLVNNEGLDRNDPKTLQAARDRSRDVKPKIPYKTLNWLGFTMMLSELGKQKELADLLHQADTWLHPTWKDGGLYYPRNDQLVDKDWNLTHIEPHSGNSGIGYARLNVENGQKKMWEHPWTKETLATRPWLDGAGFAEDLDFLRGTWDDQSQAMVFTVKRWRGPSRPTPLRIENLPPGRWAIYVNGKLREIKELTQTRNILIEVDIGEEEVDVIVQKFIQDDNSDN